MSGHPREAEHSLLWMPLISPGKNFGSENECLYINLKFDCNFCSYHVSWGNNKIAESFFSYSESNLKKKKQELCTCYKPDVSYVPLDTGNKIMNKRGSPVTWMCSCRMAEITGTFKSKCSRVICTRLGVCTECNGIAQEVAGITDDA